MGQNRRIDTLFLPTIPWAIGPSDLGSKDKVKPYLAVPASLMERVYGLRKTPSYPLCVRQIASGSIRIFPNGSYPLASFSGGAFWETQILGIQWQ